MDQAERKIEANSAAGLRAPRAYPGVARPGPAWVKAGRYWFNYTVGSDPVVVAVFYDTADIPNRL